jgi:tetratricopeptide (TPR) repeat protein
LTDGADPARAASPPVPHNLLLRRAEVLGRDAEIAALDEALRRSLRASLVAAVPAPLGGLGTTALALGYARRAVASRAYPGGVFFLHAAGRPAEALARLAPDLRSLGSPSARAALDLEPPSAPAEDAARAVKQALQAQREPSLLILDDVDTAGLAERLPLGEVRVLSTVRDERLAFRRKVAVGPLAPAVAADRARELGARPRDGSDRLALEGLVERELAGVPLAVEMAARYVLCAGSSWTAYAPLLRARARGADRAPEALAGYAPAVLAAVDLAIDHHLRGTAQRRLLEGAAVFAPHAVPLAWALAAAELPTSAAEEAVAPLLDLGLARLDALTETISLHRFVHRRVRDLTAPEAWLRAGKRAAAAVAVWLSESLSPVRLGDVDARREHIEEALTAAARSGAELSWVIIADRLGVALERRACYGEARELLERALAAAERLDPPDPGQLRVCLSNLAGLLVEVGEARAARPLLERALAIDDAPDEEAPSSVRLSKLSRALTEVGHGEAAQPLLAHVLTEGADAPPAPAGRLPDSARVLHEMKQAPGGGELIERTLSPGQGAPPVTTLLRTVEQAASSPATDDGAPTAAELTSLGLSLYALGHPGDARPLLERALVSDEAVHGPDHPEVAADLMNLAAVLRSLGERHKARACLARAQAIAEAALPEGDTLRVGIAARLARA